MSAAPDWMTDSMQRMLVDMLNQNWQLDAPPDDPDLVHLKNEGYCDYRVDLKYWRLRSPGLTLARRLRNVS